MNVKAHLGVCAVYIPFVCSKTISSLSSISRSEAVCALLQSQRERESEIQHEFLFSNHRLRVEGVENI